MVGKVSEDSSWAVAGAVLPAVVLPQCFPWSCPHHTPPWVRWGACQAQTHWIWGSIASACNCKCTLIVNVSLPPLRFPLARAAPALPSSLHLPRAAQFLNPLLPFHSSFCPNSSNHSRVWQVMGRDVGLKACPYILRVSFITCAFTAGKFRSLNRLIISPLRRN